MFTRETKLGIFAAFTTLTAFALSSNAVPPLITTIARDFGVNFETMGGYFILVQFSVFALASLAGGWAAERFGWSNRSFAATGVIALSLTLMIGAAFPSFPWFLALAVPLGFAGGLVETFSSILICRFGGPSSSKMLNLSQVFFCFGALFAPSFAGGILAFGISWRIALVGLGGLALLIGLFFIRMTRNLKEPVIELPPVDQAASPTTLDRIPIKRDPMFYLMAAALFLYVVVEGSIVVWIPSYFEKHLHVPADSAAWRLSVFWLGIVCGRSLMLILHGPWTLWPAALIGAAGMLVGDAILVTRWSVPASTLIVFLVGLAGGPLWPVIVTLSQHLRNSPRFTSGVIGAGALGAGLGPFFSSYVIKWFGMRAYFPVLAALGVLLVASLFQAHSQAKKAISAG